MSGGYGMPAGKQVAGPTGLVTLAVCIERLRASGYESFLITSVFLDRLSFWDGFLFFRLYEWAEKGK